MAKNVDPVLFNKNLLSNASYAGGKTLNEIDLSGIDKIYKLSSNENPIGPSPKATDAIRKHLNNVHIYPDRTDIRLREALVSYFNEKIDKEHFITSNSGVGLLEMICRAFLKEGDNIIISNPAFSPYEMFAGKMGAETIDIPLKAPDFSLDTDKIIASINYNTRLIFITNPNNPTGTYIPKKEIDKLVANLPEHTILIYDEVYYHFSHASDYTTGLGYVLNNENVITVNSFAKSYGLAGLRIGFGYGKPELMNYLRKFQRPFFINILGLEAGIAALSDKNHILKTVQTVFTQKERIYEALEKLGIQFWKTQANFILIKPSIDELLFEELMLKQGIMVRPVANFGAPGHIRITIGNEEATTALIKALIVVSNNL